MFVQVLWEVKLPTPAVILNSKNHQKSFTALSMLENGISIDPDFSNFSRLTVEVVVLFPKDCHEGTMVKLCAETEWCSTCQCLLSRPRFGVWRLGLTSEASKIFGTKLGGEFVNCDPGPQQFFVGQSWRWWDFSCYAWGFGIGMKKKRWGWCDVDGLQYMDADGDGKQGARITLLGRKLLGMVVFVPTSPHFSNFSLTKSLDQSSW